MKKRMTITMLYITFHGDLIVSQIHVASYCFVDYKPPTELNEFIKVLDQRADKARQSTKHYSAEHKQRKDGTVAATTPPLGAPKWAVHGGWTEQGRDSLHH